MGLSAPKKRLKIAHDPNNVSWSRNTTSYGHRLLTSQGWSPGSTLGATSASHAPHYTAASSSHIRVLLKDDNLGLGATSGGKQSEETFGLGQLADIYGRLNGKSDVALDGEKRARADLGGRLYVQQRFGGMPFVRGGFLVGDRMEEEERPRAMEQKRVATEEDTKVDDAATQQKEKKKKRKRAETETEAVNHEEATASISAATTPSNTSVGEKTGQTGNNSTEEDRRYRKEERRKAKAARKTETETEAVDDEGTTRTPEHATTTPSKTSAGEETTQTDHTETKEERRHRKEERRKAKAAKSERKAAKTARREARAERRQLKEAKRLRKAEETSPETSTPNVSMSNAFNNRNTVRQRFIKQKRMASMDPTALREILMLKA